MKAKFDQAAALRAVETVRELSGEIADSLSGWKSPGDELTYRSTLLNNLLDAALVLQRAFLANHPADNEEPITEAWLRTVGFVWRADWQSWANDGRDIVVALYRSTDAPGEWTMQYEDEFCWPAALATRRHVRRLLAALSIPVDN